MHFFPNDKAAYGLYEVLGGGMRLKYSNPIYIDLSGWSSKYFPQVLVQYANTLLKDKVLFGGDFPLITPERWMSDLEKTEIRDDVKPGLFKANAARLFGLLDGAAA
jgi:predicted TIM-barrel fold metal-dependent hydrolase